MNKQEIAKLIAKKIHSNQSYGIFPYMYHIESVVEIAISAGYSSDEIIISCILHDAIEDSNLTYHNIKQIFGIEIAEIIFAVSDELGRNRKERKAKTYPKIKTNSNAIIVKLCDRIANMKHSKLFDTQKYQMYQKEKDEFFKELFNINFVEDDKNMKCLFDQLKAI